METFTCQLANASKQWPESRLEELEACREASRNTCLLLGITKDTTPLGSLWVGITKAQVKNCGFSGSDVDIRSIGVPLKCLPLEHVKNLNPYQRKALEKDMLLLSKMLPSLETMWPSLMTEVSNLVSDLTELAQV